MQELILCKLGEMALKGLNRRSFEQTLYDNMRKKIAPYGSFSVTGAQSTIYVEPKAEGADMDGAFEALCRVFGIISLSRAAVCDKQMEQILSIASDYTKEPLSHVHTFKVEARRADKRFPLNSMQIMEEVGAVLLEANPHLKVDVHTPELIVYVEVRDFGAYIHAGKVAGAGGMPLGTGGKATLLLSGGIDSPVAGYLVSKRGVVINAVHFHSYPYTSERAREKVCELAHLLCRYCEHVRLFVVPFTEIQTEIKRQVPEEHFTLVMRRYMMKIAERIAKKTGSMALITGESIGQVASQTLQALAVTDDAVNMPVFRPCIGMDKEEIVRIARRIGTFETSILPYEDCCTVFTPKHPTIRPELANILRSSAVMAEEELIDRAVAGVEPIDLREGERYEKTL